VYALHTESPSRVRVRVRLRVRVRVLSSYVASYVLHVVQFDPTS
jgi:hypothetical protein